MEEVTDEQRQRAEAIERFRAAKLKELTAEFRRIVAGIESPEEIRERCGHRARGSSRRPS